MFDSEMGMKVHVSSINRFAYPQLKNIIAIKPFLDMEAANTAAHALLVPVLSRHFTEQYVWPHSAGNKIKPPEKLLMIYLPKLSLS